MGKVKTKWIEDGAITFPKLNQSVFGESENHVARGNHTHPSAESESLFTNILINSNFTVSQRAETYTTLANSQYVLDCWHYDQSGAMAYSSSRSNDTPTVEESGHRSLYSLKLTNTETSTLNTDSIVYVTQPIEGSKFSEYIGLTMVLSFWVKSSLPGTYSVAITNNTDCSCVVEYDIFSANTWELKAVLFPLNFTIGTWNSNNELGAMLVFTLASGSTYQTTTLGEWVSNRVFSSQNQLNHAGTLGATFQLSQVQLKQYKEGTTTVGIYQSFRFTTEYQLCQRYYEKTYAHVYPPGSATDIGIKHFPFITSKVSAWIFSFLVEKRTSPNMAIYDMNGNINAVSALEDNDTLNHNLTLTSPAYWDQFDLYISESNLRIHYDSKSTKLTTFFMHYIADANLL